MPSHCLWRLDTSLAITTALTRFAGKEAQNYDGSNVVLWKVAQGLLSLQSYGYQQICVSFLDSRYVDEFFVNF